MFFIFNVLSCCQLYEITNQTMETFILKPGDKLNINVSKSNYFIHVQDHFFYGALDIDVFNTTTNNYSRIHGKQRNRLRFTQCALQIYYNYTSTCLSICKITVWTTSSRDCNCDSIHYSGVSSAHFEVTNYSLPYKACYFFELAAKPKINSSVPALIESILFFMSDDGTFTKKKIDSNITDLSISKLSILSQSHYLRANISYNFNLATDLKFVDFTSKDSYFKVCVNDKCNSTNLEVPGFVIKRNVVWWMWLIVYIVPIAFITIGISLILISPRKEIAFFSSSKLLVSENSRNSVASFF